LSGESYRKKMRKSIGGNFQSCPFKIGQDDERFKLKGQAREDWEI